MQSPAVAPVFPGALSVAVLSSASLLLTSPQGLGGTVWGIHPVQLGVGWAQPAVTGGAGFGASRGVVSCQLIRAVSSCAAPAGRELRAGMAPAPAPARVMAKNAPEVCGEVGRSWGDKRAGDEELSQGALKNWSGLASRTCTELSWQLAPKVFSKYLN